VTAPTKSNDRRGNGLSEIEIDLSGLDALSDEALLLNACYEAWNGWRGNRVMPCWRDVDLLDIPPRALPWLVVADVLPASDDGADRYIYRYWGSQLAHVHGKDMTGKTHEALSFYDFSDWTARVYGTIRERRAPVAFRGQFVTRNEVVYNDVTLRLPISDDGETVSKILSAVLLSSTLPAVPDEAVA